MRLSELEINAIVSSIEPIIEDETTLYLFGSRANDMKKGGDIDLLLITDEKSKLKLLEEKTRILSNIKKIIGDRRIDLTLFSQNELPDNSFYQTIKDEIVILKKWKKIN
jgi:uncharacterized protein